MTTVNNTIAAKFKSLINGDQFTSGTNHFIRNQVWNEFRATYSQSVTIEIGGLILTLTANHSLSGKSTSYHGLLTNDQYIALNNGYNSGLSSKNSPSITIQNGVVEVLGGGKWYFKINNNKVNIL